MVSALSLAESIETFEVVDGGLRQVDRRDLGPFVSPTTRHHLDEGELFVTHAEQEGTWRATLYDEGRVVGSMIEPGGPLNRYFRTDEGVVRLVVDPDGSAHLDHVEPRWRPGGRRASGATPARS